MRYVIICNEEKAISMGLRTPGDVRENICYHCCPCGDCTCKYVLFEDNIKAPFSEFNPEGHRYSGI